LLDVSLEFSHGLYVLMQRTKEWTGWFDAAPRANGRAGLMQPHKGIDRLDAAQHKGTDRMV
jgi:hypothetical protein